MYFWQFLRENMSFISTGEHQKQRMRIDKFDSILPDNLDYFKQSKAVATQIQTSDGNSDIGSTFCL